MYFVIFLFMCLIGRIGLVRKKKNDVSGSWGYKGQWTQRKCVTSKKCLYVLIESVNVSYSVDFSCLYMMN